MTTTHSATVHIEAPVEQVFLHVTDPAHFYEAMPGKMRPGQGLRAKHMAPDDGVGSTYEWVVGHIGGFEIVGVLTRGEYVVNERIVDRSSTGPQWTWAIQPEGEGTRLTLEYEYSTKIPGIDKLIDVIAWRGDADLEAMTASVKEKVEAA